MALEQIITNKNVKSNENNNNNSSHERKSEYSVALNRVARS